jgi:hypothetical protein
MEMMGQEGPGAVNARILYQAGVDVRAQRRVNAASNAKVLKDTEQPVTDEELALQAELEVNIWDRANLQIVSAYQERYLELRRMNREFFADVLGNVNNLQKAFKRLADEVMGRYFERMIQGWKPLQGLVGGMSGTMQRGFEGGAGGMARIVSPTGVSTPIPPLLAAGMLPGILGLGMGMNGSAPGGAKGLLDWSKFGQGQKNAIAMAIGAPPSGGWQPPKFGGSNTIGQLLGLASIGIGSAQGGDPFSGALSGAASGFSMGGLIGAGVGGLVGLLGGLFGKKRRNPMNPAQPIDLPTASDIRFGAPALMPASAFYGGRAGGFGGGGGGAMQNNDFRGANFVFPGVTDADTAREAGRNFGAGLSDSAVSLRAEEARGYQARY